MEFFLGDRGNWNVKKIPKPLILKITQNLRE